MTVEEDNKKRGSWKLEVVEKLVKGKDGIVRGEEVRVITKRHHMRMARPLQKLYPAEVRSADTEPKETAPSIPPVHPTVNARPKRATAMDAGWKTRKMLED